MNRSPRSASMASAVERADRVDHDDPRPAGPGRLDGGPQMAVGEAGVGAPQQDELGVFEFERVHAAPRSVRHPHPGADGGTADVAIDERRSHVPEEAATEAHQRQETLVAGVGEREHRLGSVGGDHAVQAFRRSRRAPRPTRSRSNSPEPFRPTRRSGVRIRSGLYTRSRKRLTFGHSSPAENGWAALPRSFTATVAGPSPSTVAVQPHESGQSWWQVPLIVRVRRPADRHPAMIARTCGQADANPACSGSASTSSKVNHPTASVSKLMESPNGSSTSTTTVV